jgi:hypothetical protein
MTPQTASATHTHLTEDQLSGLLIGESSLEARIHFDGCGVCRAQMETFERTLLTFNQASLSWSEAKSHTLNRDLSQVRLQQRFSLGALWNSTAQWTSAAALMAVFAVAASSGVMRLQGGFVSSNAVASPVAGLAVAPAPDHAREIADDNAMLNDIDSELRPEAPPLSLSETSFSESPGVRPQLQDSNSNLQARE